jgi:hypothetical protein
MTRSKSRRTRKRSKKGQGIFTLSQQRLQSRKFAGKKGFLSKDSHLKKLGTKGDCALMYGQHSHGAYRIGVEEPGIAANRIRKYDGRTGALSAMHGMTQARFNLGCDTGQGAAFLKEKFKEWGDAGDTEGNAKKIKELNGMSSSANSDDIKLEDLKNESVMLEKYKHTNNLSQRAEFLDLKENIETDCQQFDFEGRKGTVCKGGVPVATEAAAAVGGRRRRRKKSRKKRRKSKRKSRRKRKKSRKRRRRR